MEHILKTQSSFFKAIWEGKKNFEIRYNDDRGFNAGDKVILKETEEKITGTNYTGRCVHARISYVTSFRQRDGYVVFGLKGISKRHDY